MRHNVGIVLEFKTKNNELSKKRKKESKIRGNIPYSKAKKRASAMLVLN